VSDYDVIGDVHGHASVLERLLVELGYRVKAGAYEHPHRRVVFLGDLIDRGPEQLRTMEIARRMMDAGSALMVLGNHELNALSWVTRNDKGDWCRPHNDKNRRQHAAFLDAVGEDSPRHEEWTSWFKRLPMWLDLGGLRIIHACWDPASLETLGRPFVTRELLAAERGSRLDAAVETLLKGPEIHMGGHSYADKDGHCRHEARLRWWDPDATTLATAAEIPGGAMACEGGPLGPLPDTPLDDGTVPVVPLDVPILYGHYWRTGAMPAVDNPKAACLDWSVAKGGPLVAYRWSGEPDLVDRNLVAVR
jgi:hypothetical protein